MSETATGGAATEGAPEPASGAPASGGVPEGYVPRSELDQIESRRRSLQSERDRLAAELETARAAAVKPQPTTEAPPAGSFLDAAAASTLFRAEMARERAITDARAKVSQDFPLADASVTSRNFETAEELISAAKQSHDSSKALREQIAAEARASVLAEVKQKHGLDLAPQTTTTEGQGGSTTEPTAHELASMSFSDFAKVDPAVVNKVLLAS